MEIVPIKKVKVGEQVYEQLKNMLFEGAWKTGDKLPSENALADQFHVSRITVRQALQRLSAAGLIETRLGEGSFVRKIGIDDSLKLLLPVIYLSADEIEQVFEFRKIIDVEAVRLAVKRGTKEQIEKLKEIHQKMAMAAELMGARRFSQLDTEFHSQISEMSGNILIIQCSNILSGVINSYVEEIVSRMGNQTAVAFHGKIIEAIEARDEKRAVKIMRAHLNNNVEYIERIKEERRNGKR